MGQHRQTEEFTCHCRIYNNGIPHKVARRTKNQHRQLELRLQLLQQNGQSSASQPALGHDDIPSGPSSWYDENNFEDFDNDIDMNATDASDDEDSAQESETDSIENAPFSTFQGLLATEHVAGWRYEDNDEAIDDEEDQEVDDDTESDLDFRAYLEDDFDIEKLKAFASPNSIQVAANNAEYAVHAADNQQWADTLDLFEWKCSNKVSDLAYDKLRTRLEKKGLKIESLRVTRHYLEERLKLRKVRIPCCPKGCMAFFGPGNQLRRRCGYCNAARFREDNGKASLPEFFTAEAEFSDFTPSVYFDYIPLIPRLKLLFAIPSLAKKMCYAADLRKTPSPDVIRDVWDADAMRFWQSKGIGLPTLR